MRLFVRLALVGLVALVAVGFWLNRASSPNPESLKSVYTVGQCDVSGTSLVIDFGTESNELLIEKCVSDYSGNSWDLFQAANLAVVGTEKYPVGFVCRINGFPSEQTEKCIDTPGANTGSWAFYTSTGKTWEYSPIGASNHIVSCGTAEGWRFLPPTEPTSNAPRVNPVIHSCEK